MEIQIPDLNGLPEAAKSILKFSQNEKIFLFDGEMGVGKTTLINAICEQLNTIDIPSSPTYSIVNEYSYPLGKIFHFDFFRIKTEIEAYDIGFEEYIYSGHYCFIEWPEKIRGLWPPHYVELSIKQSQNLERIIYARKI
jgi:tRNA threonylcarbamoyladenosine biosynthesis protein TsaE